MYLSASYLPLRFFSFFCLVFLFPSITWHRFLSGHWLTRSVWWIIHTRRVSLTTSALSLHVRFKVFDVLSSHWGARHCKYSCLCSCTELWFSRLINRRDQDSEEHGNATEQGVSHAISKSYIHPDIHFKNELLVQWKTSCSDQHFPLAQLWKGQFTSKF